MVITQTLTLCTFSSFNKILLCRADLSQQWTEYKTHRAIESITVRRHTASANIFLSHSYTARLKYHNLNHHIYLVQTWLLPTQAMTKVWASGILNWPKNRMENVRFEVLIVATMQSYTSGTQCSVVWCMWTNVSGEYIASILKVPNSGHQHEAGRKLELVSCLAYSLFLKMEVIYSSETLNDSL
jgi:hypothetical protein